MADKVEAVGQRRPRDQRALGSFDNRERCWTFQHVKQVNDCTQPFIVFAKAEQETDGESSHGQLAR